MTRGRAGRSSRIGCQHPTGERIGIDVAFYFGHCGADGNCQHRRSNCDESDHRGLTPGSRSPVGIGVRITCLSRPKFLLHIGIIRSMRVKVEEEIAMDTTYEIEGATGAQCRGS
jgi:hypothetical protein